MNEVAEKISEFILEFYELRRNKPIFYCDELREYVATKCLIAPASPDRILRMLRQEGWLNYEVVNRKRSEYLFHYKERG